MMRESRENEFSLSQTECTEDSQYSNLFSHGIPVLQKMDNEKLHFPDALEAEVSHMTKVWTSKHTCIRYRGQKVTYNDGSGTA